ncbi:MAG: hypothetical protein ACRYHQ_14555 [Janthinobacterium lividum]
MPYRSALLTAASLLALVSGSAWAQSIATMPSGYVSGGIDVVTKSDVGVANGVAPLNSSGLVPTANLPASSIAATASASTAITPTGGTSTTLGNITSTLTRVDTPEAHGSVGNGTTDDTAAVQAALDAVSAEGGGSVFLSKEYAITSANLTIPTGVKLTSNAAAFTGSITGDDYRSLTPALRLGAGYTILPQQGSAVSNFAITPTSLIAPTSYRTAIDSMNAWAGTAVTVGTTAQESNAVALENLFILGFNTAVSTENSNEFRFRHIFGDDTNGIVIDNSHDVSRVENSEFFPYYTVNQGYALYTYPITGAANNGSGLIRLTLSAAQTTFQTGDIVYVSAVGGVTAANNRWTATVVDSTHVDLQGSTFSGT